MLLKTCPSSTARICLFCNVYLFFSFFQLNLEERLKETLQQMVTGVGAESEVTESLDDLKVELQRREKALRATEEERDTLMSELEELDRQSQEATQV